ncbi:hypothetical protein U9M48_004750 [Paspalum notatum var. saurae]|uniref:Uncharacterized protein n=1 Tax=Paspalum notatum var. saurae TaxID=547442 RepID=A0AAQ3PNK8_PASNO
MSAPPPLAVDFYDDDGFDWEAAVRENDIACALASASASASAPAAAPAHHPLPPRPPEPPAAARHHRPPAAAAAGGGAVRQATLDCFVDSFTKRRLEKESPAPAPATAPAGARVGLEPGSCGVGRPGVRAGEGCSRQADEKAVEDRFVESFTRRQREKERAAPAVPVAPARGRGRGRGRPASRAGKGSSRRANVEVEFGPCAVALDHEAVQTWIYPSILPVTIPAVGTAVLVLNHIPVKGRKKKKKALSLADRQYKILL